MSVANALILMSRDEAAALVRAAWIVVGQEGTMPPKPAEIMLVSAVDKLTRAFGLDQK